MMHCIIICFFADWDQLFWLFEFKKLPWTSVALRTEYRFEKILPPETIF